MSFGYVGNGTQTLSVRGRTLVGLAIALAVLAIVTAGSVLASSHLGTTADTIVIPLGSLNDSGQSGWATLTVNGSQTDVAVTLSAGALQSELMHTHQGSCSNLGGVDYPLTSFVGGSGDSATTLSVSLSSIRDGNHAVNVHEAGNPGNYTACGDIPGVIQPGGGTLSFAGGDVGVKAPDGATSAAVDIAYFPESADSIVIPLGGMNDSGQRGWATLTANGVQTDVAVALSAGALESELIHIHQGSCANLGGVDHPLTSFVDGAGDSITTVAASLSSLRNGNQTINIHEAGNPGNYTACGDIPVERPAPAGLVLGSQVFSLAVMKSGVLQNNFSFSQFVSVTVKYSAADKAAAGGRDDNVALYIYDTASGSWIEIGSALPNVIDQTLTLSQQTLGTYAIVLDTGGVLPTPTAAPVDTTTPPDTGDLGVSTGMMLALGLVGVFFVLGGGYMVARGRRSN